VRTLVLVDGKRFIPADVTGLTDLGTIPDGLIDRVEIVTGGASAVYGSDAIAGAVNFVLKRDFEGADLRYQYGWTSESDGQSRKLDLLLGANSPDGKGNIILHGSYVNRDPVFMGNRDFSKLPLLANAQGVLQPFGSGNIPGGLIGLNAAQRAQIVGVPNLLNQNGACPGGNIQGVRFGQDGTPLPFCRPTEQYNYAAVNFLQRPLEQWQVSTMGHYEVAPGVEAYAQLFYTKKENEFQQAPEAVAPQSSGQESGTVLITNADTNPLFPIATRNFFAQNRAFFDPDGDGIFTVRGTQRRFEEFGPRNTSITSDSFMLTGGLRGNVTLLEDDWKWDAFYQTSRSDVEFLQSNLLSRSRTTLGLDTVVVNGQVRCRNALLNCVPVNIFGTNTLTPQMADFLSVDSGRSDEFTRDVAGATITGNLFALPAGEVATAFGVEWRREEFVTDPAEIASDLASTPVAPLYNEGAFEVWELFTEFRVPVVNDLPGVQSLAFEGAARYSDYTTIGGVTTWRAGLDWEILDWVRFRGGYSSAIRAPNLNELYASPTSGFTGGRDPCWTTSNPTPAIRAFCVQQGVPANAIGSFVPGASQGWFTRSGGNAALQEEESKTITAGLVFTPTAVPGLSITVDYYNIEVEEAVAQVTSQLLVNSCFTLLDANSAACRSITRLSSGQIDQVNAPLLNVANREVSGVDLQIQWQTEAPGWMSLPNHPGTLRLLAVGSFQTENTQQLLSTLPSIDCAGYYEGTCSGDGTRIAPDYRGLYRADWSSGPLRVGFEIEHIGNIEVFPGLLNENGTVGDEFYVDLTVSWQVTDWFELTVGTNNLFDNEPPVLGFTGGGDSNTNIPLYDPLGRRYFMTGAMKF
jgi:outer membrane receptor protein involved in Fe transport